MLALNGSLTVVGSYGPIQANVMDLMMGRQNLSSSATGGRPDTAEMLAFCAEHDITADIELLLSGQVQQARRVSRPATSARVRPGPRRLD